MITISTREFVGMLKDVSPFASTEAGTAENVVRLEWDGETLTASATDRVRAAKEIWTPDEEQYDQNAEDEYVTYKVDSETPLFSVRLELEDVKSIIKAFGLKGAKKQHAPIKIEVTPSSFAGNTYTVRLTREALPGVWSPLAFHATGAGAPGAGDIPEVDIEDLIARTQNVEAYLPGVAFNAEFLNAFPKVRPLGPLELNFTGEHKLVRFNMGSRFRGVIQPVRVETPDHEYARQ